MSDPFITNEDLSVEVKHDVYPFINPSALFKSQAFKGKVVLVTGASRGIGQETAVKFGQAGASVVLVARTEMALEETKSAILKIRPDAKILAFSADVTDAVRAKEIVGATVAELGRLDILVANAGIVRAVDAPFTAKDPLGWWKVLEVNLRGVYNYAHFAIPYLKESSGTLIAVSSCLAQIRIPFNSEYGISKLALSRFIEYAVLEHTEISAFSVHPGMIAGTEAHKTSGATIPTGMEDTAALPAAVFLFLASGRASYLNGRYVSVNWDLEQVEREWKDKIIEQNSLVSKLSIPVQS